MKELLNRLVKFKVEPPTFTGVKVFEDIPLEELAITSLDKFFKTWDLHGRYPNILEDSVGGEGSLLMLTYARSNYRRRLVDS